MTFFSRFVPQAARQPSEQAAPSAHAPVMRDLAVAMNGWHVELGPSLLIKSITDPSKERPEAPFLSELPLGFTLWEAVGHGTVPKGQWAELFQRLEQHAFIGDFEYSVRHDVRGARHYTLSAIPDVDGDGTFIGYHCLILDNTERVLEKETLRTTDAHLSSVFEYCPNTMTIRTIEGRFLKLNPEAERIFGVRSADAVGRHPAELFDTDAVNQIVHGDETVLETEEVVRLEEVYRVEDETRTFLTVKFPVFDPDQCLVGVGSLGTDITERKRAEAQLHTTSNFDRLTNLPNRMLAVDRLKQALGTAARTGKSVALLSLEVEHFKAVAAAYGQENADQLVRHIAESLSKCIRGTDTLARVGADDFWIMLSNMDPEQDVADILAKIFESYAPKFEVDGNDIATGLCVGYAVYPFDAEAASDLIRNADAAVRKAKTSEATAPVRYTEALSAESKWRQEIAGQLQGALARDEFYICYQPIVCPQDQTVSAVEALIRWDNPQLGRVGPDQFIPVAESSGLIEDIGAWVLEKACSDAVQWNAHRSVPVAVSVNVSSRQLTGQDFIRRVMACMSSTGLHPSLLKLEITESCLVTGSSDNTSLLEDLRAQGVSLSLDDFGTGYSALSYLQRLPFDTIKLDRSFITELKTFDEHEVALIETIIHMGKRLGMTIIAEGVENKDQIDYLRAQECDLLQGYFFSKPLILTELMEFLEHAKSSGGSVSAESQSAAG